MPNRLFVNRAMLDAWVTAGRVELDEGALGIRGTSERFSTEEAVRVLAEVTGSGDPQGLVGKVHSVLELRELGAEVVDRSLVLGDQAYDVDPGFMVVPKEGALPVETLVGRLSELSRKLGAGQSDEDILARYLMRKL